MAGKKRQARSKLPSQSIFIVTGILILLFMFPLYMYSQTFRPKMNEAITPTPDSTVVTPTPAFPIGYVNGCVSQPGFIQTIGMGQKPIIGTSARGVMGFVVINPDTGAYYQDATWDDAGYLGPYAYTQDGDFYVSPVPLTSLEVNPPAEQNRIYRIASQSGEMALYLALPSVLPPSTGNPFGVLGLHYDCDTRSLYATSVSGSTPADEIGRVYRIDLDTGTVEDQLEQIDAFGVGVFNGIDEKRLYYGKARYSELYSISLDEQGNFVGEPRLEFSTSSLPNGDNRKIRRIVFTRQNEMFLYAIDFDFTLRSSSVIETTRYQFTYDDQQGEWMFIEAIKETR
jgi:hypothetical protein